MRSLLYPLIITLTALLNACNTELPLPASTADKKIVLLGELTANDSMHLRAGQSGPLNTGGAGLPLIEGLHLSAEDIQRGGSIALEEREDFVSIGLYTLPFTSAAMVAPGRDYRVAGRHPQLGEVRADVSIPKPFTARLAGTSFTNYSGDSVLLFDIDITDPDAVNAQYVIEALKQPVAIDGYFYFDGNEFSINTDRVLYDSLKRKGINIQEWYDTVYSGIFTRQSVYTSDMASENGVGKLFGRIFLQGKSFGGTIHHTQILVPRKAVYGLPDQYAQTVINVKSVAADYYTFLKAYEQYDPSSGLGGNTNPANLPGNVQGGFGMIGGVYLWQTAVLY